MCKGSCRRKPTEGLFLQPFHHFVVPLPLHRGGEIRTPLGEACKRASHTRKSLTQGRLIQPSPVGEGGSRRLTDEVYFAKNFNNCFIQTLQLKNRGDFSSLFFNQSAALPHLFSSLFSLISYLRAAVYLFYPKISRILKRSLYFILSLPVKSSICSEEKPVFISASSTVAAPLESWG